LALAGASAGQAHAGGAIAASELHVKIAITADRLVNINMNITDFTESFKSGYGLHEEDNGGEASALLKSYESGIFATTFAFSPPTSDSRSGIGEKPGQIAVIDNFSDAPKSVSITFSADLFLDAFAEGPFSYAAASGAYSYTGSGSAAALKFSDRGAIHVRGGQGITEDRPKEVTFTFMLPAQGTYRLFDGGSAVAALAHASEAPEPASWALMLAGLALVGTAVRRTRAHRAQAPAPPRSA